MNIPDYRKSIAGRTWPQQWNPIAVEHHRRRKHSEVIDALFAVAIGIGGALMVFFYLSK